MNHALFDTAVGTCGIAWGPAGITGVSLPESTPEATRARLMRAATRYNAQRDAGIPRPLEAATGADRSDDVAPVAAERSLTDAGRVPHADGDATAAEATPPPAVAAVIADIVALMAGEDRRFTADTLDMAGVPDFHRRVYAVALAIPPGSTLTYGEVAARMGAPGASRAVGRALGENPFPIVVPCHRVLAAGGRTGGFSAPGGVDTKFRMLTIEKAGRGDDLFGGLPLAVAPRRR